MCVVDLHNHIVTEDVVALLAAEGERLETRIVEEEGGRFARIGESGLRPLHQKMCDPAARIGDMDRMGIDVQAVSCTPFVLYPDAPQGLGIEVARVNNDSLAQAALDHPGRFAPLASVPLRDPKAAADELKRAVGLGLHGVEIPPSSGGIDLDDRALEPFWSAAEEEGAAVCIHPFDASPQGALGRYLLSPLIGNLMDTGVAATLLVMGGVLERHPKLEIVLYHGGGTFPALLARIEKGHELFEPCRSAAPRPPSSYLHHFSFDSVTFDLDWLRYLVGRFGADQVVLGTDYPLPLGPKDPVAEIKALRLPAEDERRILGGNAKRLLRLDDLAEEA